MTVRLIPHRFQCQIQVIALDVGLDIVPEGWPVVLPSQPLVDILNAKMSHQRIVVMTGD